MPFITEEIFQAIPHEGEALIVAPYPKYDEALAFPEDEAGFERVMEVIRAVRSRRAEMNVPPSRKAKLIVCALDQDTYRAGAKYLTRLASASEVEVRVIAGAGSDEEESAEGMITVTTPSARVLMPMAELVEMCIRDRSIFARSVMAPFGNSPARMRRKRSRLSSIGLPLQGERAGTFTSPRYSLNCSGVSSQT